MRFLALRFCVCALALAPAFAAAQGSSEPSAAPQDADAGSAPGPSDAEPKAQTPGAGYSYHDAPRAKPKARRRASTRATGPMATLPGFEEHDDGSSRLFVRLSSAVAVEEQQGKGRLTFVLKGARVRSRNNTNILETAHFDTPVLRARLVPKKDAVDFVVELRASVTPTWKVVDEKDSGAVLTIDFPKGTVARDGAAQGGSN